MTVVWCLSGGGIKGAFQVGASVALHRLDPSLAPDRIAGTSVGAVNALSLSGFDLPEACGVLLDEYLRLENRQGMFDVAEDFEHVFTLEPLSDEEVTLRDKLGFGDAIASGNPTAVLGLVLEPVKSEIFGVVRDTILGGVIGGALGPIGALVGGAIAAAVSGDETSEDIERLFAAFGNIHSFYHLGPIAARIRGNIGEMDLSRLKPVRFECVAFEDGRTYAVDQDGQLRVGLDEGDFPLSTESLIGSVQSNITKGILASAAIPLAFEATVLLRTDEKEVTCVDGGVRNVYPMLSTLELLHDATDPRLVMIGNSANLNRLARGWEPWPAFDESPSAAQEFRPHLGPSGALLAYAGRSVDIRTNDAIAMGRRLLNQEADSVQVIEPTLSVINAAQVDPGLIRIWMAYGYLRAADELQSGRRQRRAFYWSSDWMTAARRSIWTNEQSGGPVALALNRILYLGTESLTVERQNRAADSVPPPATRLRDDYLAPAGRTTPRSRLDLRMDGRNWMLLDEMFRNGEMLERGDDPFAMLRGRWPRTEQAIKARASALARLGVSDSGIVLSDAQNSGGAVLVSSRDEVTDTVQPAFDVNIHAHPFQTFPLWIAGTLGMVVASGGGRLGVVFGIDPFRNDLVATILFAPGPGGPVTSLPAVVAGFDGLPSDQDHLVGVLDNVAVAGGRIIVRGESGDFWVGPTPSWVRIRPPTDVSLRRRDVPNEGHIAVADSSGIVQIFGQTHDGSPIRIQLDASANVTRWRTHKIEWPDWPSIGELNRSVVGTQLPGISTAGGGGVLVHAADGYIWWVPFDDETVPREPELVARQRFPFVLTGTSRRRSEAVLAGVDGNVLRRLKVTIGDDGNHSISECPTLDLADNNLQHFGRALANTEDSSDVVAVVPVIADDQPAWAWVDGCGTEPPRLLVSDGLGTNITPNRD